MTEYVFLDSGDDIEAQLKRLNLRKRRRWFTRISRGTWLRVGLVAGMLLAFVCMLAAIPLAIMAFGL